MAGSALVLGGGGPVGIAWECGLIAGLARAGVRLAQADLIMGTSAGSFVGARLALSDDPADLAKPILAEAARTAAVADGGRDQAPPADTGPLMRLLSGEGAEGASSQELRQRIGAFALEARTMNETSFIASFGKRFASLPETLWPERNYACTAVDADTGEFVLWTRDSAVGLTRAVASSCSVPGVYPPVTLNGRRYIDGGMRSGTNADLATGYERVVVIALRVGASGPAAERAAAKLASEVGALEAQGAQVRVVAPDAESQEVLGQNLMDFRRRPAAAQAGLDQATREAEALAAFWS